MPRPTQLVKPPLAAFQFINYFLHGTRKRNRKVIMLVEQCLSAPPDDTKYGQEHFSSAFLVKPEFMKPMAAMSDATFERLVGGFGFTIHGIQIKTKNDLAHAASIPDPYAYQSAFIQECEIGSLEQIQAYFLFHNKSRISVNWHDVVDQYNASEPDQQEAIYQFFKRIMKHSLYDLLAMGAPEPLPANLFPLLDTKIVDGKPCTYNEFSNSFIEDQHMILNFRVVGFRGKSRNDFEYVIATTMTLEEAIAMAIRYTQEITEKDSLQQITIHYGDNEIAAANIMSARPIPPGSFDRSLPARLRWNFDDSVKSGISPERFTQAIIAAEDAMGVKWRKGIMLEDALGL